MTSIADITGRKVVDTLATGDGAIMAIKTGPHDLRVVHRGCGYRHPRRWKYLMTGIANITAGDMRCALATGRYSIMTKHTVSDKRRMIRRNTTKT
jgi:hypothetical protein